MVLHSNTECELVQLSKSILRTSCDSIRHLNVLHPMSGCKILLSEMIFFAMYRSGDADFFRNNAEVSYRSHKPQKCGVIMKEIVFSNKKSAIKSG